uniref:Hepcidin n=1 Tax=Knipowitschia caucasica TaxID=637954 RepID=A0AAV2MBJ1_KNICA
MKTLSVAAAVAVLVAFVWIQESCGQAPAQTAHMEEQDQDTAAELGAEEGPEELMASPYYKSREKRGFKCKLCCGCCTPGVCGLCCKKRF